MVKVANSYFQDLTELHHGLSAQALSKVFKILNGMAKIGCTKFFRICTRKSPLPGFEKPHRI